MDSEPIKRFFDPHEWGFSTFERRAILLFLFLILLGSFVRFRNRTNLSSYVALWVEPTDSSSLAAADSAAHSDTVIFRPNSASAEDKRSSRYPIIDVNSASAEQLDRLPGIGPVKAAAIISYREQHGAFRTVDDLARVKGIGKKTVARLHPYVTIRSP